MLTNHQRGEGRHIIVTRGNRLCRNFLFQAFRSTMRLTLVLDPGCSDLANSTGRAFIVEGAT